MITRHEITEEEFEVILKAIKSVLGNPSGCIDDKDYVECCSESEHCTSMCWDTFKDGLKSQFIIRNKR